MKKPRKSVAMDNAVEQLKSLIPALEQYLSEEAAEPAHQDAPAVPAEPVEGGLGETPAVEGDEEGAEEGANPPEAVQAPAAAPAGGPAEILTKIKELLESMGAPAAGSEAPVVEDADGDLGGLRENSNAISADEGDPDDTAEDCENNGKASQGPTAGVHAAGDAAIRKSIYKDMANKDKLYNRVKPIIGVFDDSLMTCEDLAVYAAKKLNINAPKGSASIALDSFLSGAERSKVTATKPVTNAFDSTFGAFDPIDQYLKDN